MPQVFKDLQVLRVPLVQQVHLALMAPQVLLVQQVNVVQQVFKDLLEMVE